VPGYEIMEGWTIPNLDQVVGAGQHSLRVLNRKDTNRASRVATSVRGQIHPFSLELPPIPVMVLDVLVSLAAVLGPERGGVPLDLLAGAVSNVAWENRFGQRA